MAHMIDTTAGDTMVAVGQAPWHGLGTVLPADVRLTTAEALAYANLETPVTRVEAFAKLADGSYSRIPDGFATVRGNAPLASVGRDYTVLQDSVALGVLDDAVTAGRARWETVGRLKGGRVVWGLVKLNASFAVLPGDEVSTYALVSNAHDGSRKASVSLTPIRVVCNNTLQASDATRTQSNSVQARHTSGVVAAIEAGAARLNIIREQITATADVYRAMAGTQLTSESLARYIAEVYPDPAGEAVSNSRVKGIRERILAINETGAGHDIPGVMGTLWGAYNAITEYVDHERGIPDGKVTVSAGKADTRLESIWFGSGKAIKGKAFDLARAMVR